MKTKKNYTQFWVFLAMLFVFVGVQQAYSAAKTFTTAGTDNKWSTAANWSGSSLPTTSDDITIPTGQTCLVDGNYSVQFVTLAGTAVLKPASGGTYTLTVTTATGGIGIDMGGVGTTLSATNGAGRLNIVMAGTTTQDIKTYVASQFSVYDFTVSSGAIVTYSQDFQAEVYGNFTVQGTGSFIQTVTTNATSKIQFNNANTVITKSTTGTLTFGSIQFAATASNCSTASDFTVRGDVVLLSGAKFHASAGTITMTAATNASVITNTSTNTYADLGFFNLSLVSANAITNATPFTIAGNFVNNGAAFTCSAGSVIWFNNTASVNSPRTITNPGGAITFFTIKVADGSHVETAVSFAIIGQAATATQGLFVFGTGSFKATAGTITFSEVTAAASDAVISCSSQGTLEFFNLAQTASANNSVITSSKFTIKANFTVGAASSFVASTPSEVIFDNDGSLTNEITCAAGSVVTFYSLTLADHKSQDPTKYTKVRANLVGALAMTISGNLNVYGNSFFDATNGTTLATTVTFAGATTKNIVNNASRDHLVFYNLTIANTASNVVNTQSDFKVTRILSTVVGGAGKLVASGNSTIELTHTDPLTSAGAANTVFQNLLLSGAVVATTAYDCYIKGDLTVLTSADLDGVASVITFNGTQGQSITATSTTFRDVTINNTFGIVLKSDMSLYGTLTITNGNLDINGDNVITLTTTTSALSDASGKTIINSKPQGVGYLTTAPAGVATVAASLISLGFTGASGALVAGEYARVYYRSYNISGKASVSKVYYLSANAGARTITGFKFYDSEVGTNNISNLSLYKTTFANAAVDTLEYTSAANGWFKFVATGGTVSVATTPTNYYNITAGATAIPAAAFVTMVEEFAKIRSLPETSIDPLKKLAGSPLLAGSTTKSILSFGITATGVNSVFKTMTINLSRDPSGILKNFKFFSVTAANITNAATVSADAIGGAAVQTGTLVQSGSLITVTGIATTLTAGTTIYFYLTADVESTVGSSTPNIYAYFTNSNLSVDYTTVSNVSMTGTNYSFTANQVTLGSGNAPTAGPIEKGATAQKIYGFKVIGSDYTISNSMTSVIINASLSNGALTTDYTNFKLYNDLNKNGIIDAGDVQYGSTIATMPITGVLSFNDASNGIITAATKENYLMVVDVASGAASNSVIQCQITSYADVTVSPASIAAGGPFYGNPMTVRAADVPTKLEIIGFSLHTLVTDKTTTQVTTGSNCDVMIQAQDATGYPQKVTSSTNLGLSIVSTGGTAIGGTTTGTIANNNSTAPVIAGVQFTNAVGEQSFKLVVAPTSGMLTLTNAELNGIQVFATQPTVFPNGLAVTNIGPTGADIAWTQGAAGVSEILVLKDGSYPTSPTDGIQYNASGNFSTPNATNGTTGTGCVVVYDGNVAAQAVTVSGLTAGHTYYAQAFPYNGLNYGTNYLVDYSAAQMTGKGYFTTFSSEPTTPSSALTYTNVTPTSMKVTWTKGNGAKSLVLVYEGSAVAVTPVDTNNYTASTVYGTLSSRLVSAGSYAYVVYNGTGNTVDITGLKPYTRYYFAIYDFNGSDYTTNYLTSTFVTGNRYTLYAEPTIQSSNLTFSEMTIGTNTSLKANWTRGNGTGCLLLVKEGSAISASDYPTDATVENGVLTNGASGQVFGTTTAQGNAYIMYVGSTGTAVGASQVVTGLQYGQRYYFKVFEYNGFGNVLNNDLSTTVINYMTSDATNNPNSRLADAWEDNNTLVTAKNMAADGTIYSGIISDATDADWFSFRPDFDNSKNNVRVKVTGVPKNYTLELYTSAGRLLRRSRVLGTGDEVIVVNNMPVGDYYIKVYSEAGEYSLVPYRVTALQSGSEYRSNTP
ncbi:MAG: fibronectin type III domain-containing protein [Candidatus Kapabacteria bacterium]|nr:fibronectin type III domain-containing protein [Candidatus Kapabacteria bacterium]